MKTILIDAVHTFVSDKGVINKNIYSLIKKYDTQKIILTNAPQESFKKFGLDKVPYPVFTLEKNPAKTDDGYYEKMLDHFTLDANDCIYFEHNADAVHKAQELGIKSFHYKGDFKKLSDFINENI